MNEWLLWAKIRRKWSNLLFDVVSIGLAFYSAFLLRFNFSVIPEAQYKAFYLALPSLYLLQLASFYYFKTYRGLWRYCSLNDVLRVCKAVLCTSLLAIPAFYLLNVLDGIPRSVMPLYGLVLTSLMVSARAMVRWYYENPIQTDIEVRERVIIIGAGRAAESLIRDLKLHKSYHCVGILDDNQSKWGQEIHGVRVLGSVKQCADFVKKHHASLLFVAIPSARAEQMRGIYEFAKAAQIPIRTLPGLSALVQGRVALDVLREIRIEDLLGREPVLLDWESIRHNYQGKRILISGAGGSIGSELCFQLAKLNPRSLCLLDHSEFNLYQIEQKLKEHYPELALCLNLVSVADVTSLREVFANYEPQAVFHAAAYKHVPMLESQLRIALLNNVLGTQNIADTAAQFDVEKFVLISTDKAVNPKNVMGASKRLAEIYCQNLNERSKTQYITVRFGNVLGSAGSVVPLFQKQIQDNKALTVTHPDIKRYFMTIPEACQLILQASSNGTGGEIFVLDMGEPIKIVDLAKQMIALSGKELGIEFTGLRPGEKLFEELFHPSEELVATTHEQLFKAKIRLFPWNELEKSFSLLRQACMRFDEDEMVVIMKTLVPEFDNKVRIQPEDVY